MVRDIRDHRSQGSGRAVPLKLNWAPSVPAPDGQDQRCDACVFAGFLCIVDQMHTAVNDLCHVAVLVCDRKHCCAAAPFLMIFFSIFRSVSLRSSNFAASWSRMIPECCISHITFHIDEVVESFVTVSIPGRPPYRAAWN